MTLERKQMLERERTVVKDLHRRGISCAIGYCVICQENAVDEEKIRATLNERGAQYGDYGNMSYVAQKIKDVIRDGGSWSFVSPLQRESLDMIATKIARIVCGDPNYRDSWHDIAGYAKLAEDQVSIAPAAGPGSATP